MKTTLFHVVSPPMQNADTLKEMLENGANPNVQCRFGWTPLMYACTHGCLSSVRLLLAHGANVCLRNKAGNIAIDLAEHNNHYDIVVVMNEHK